MYRAVCTIGWILIAGGVLFSKFSKDGFSGIGAINIGLFLVVGGALVGALYRAIFGRGTKKKEKKHDSSESIR